MIENQEPVSLSGVEDIIVAAFDYAQSDKSIVILTLIRNVKYMIVKFVLITITTLFLLSCVSTKTYDKEQVDTPPVFTGGNTDIYRFIMEDLNFSEQLKQENISGKHVVKFTVGKNGRLSNIKFIQSIGFGLDEELVRVLKSMPKWDPAIKNGRKVNCSFTLPLFYEP